jgi:hypothetical protein
MVKWVNRLVILVLILFAGRWVVNKFMEMADAQYEARDEFARKRGEQIGRKMEATIQTGEAQRARDMGRVLEEAHQSRGYDTLLPPRH